MSYCHRCGHRISKGDNVCTRCGIYLRKRHKENNNNLSMIIKAIILIVLIWFILSLFN